MLAGIDLVSHHQILRTAFVVVDGQSFQVIQKPAQVGFPAIDLHSSDVTYPFIIQDMEKGVDFGAMSTKCMMVKHTPQNPTLVMRISHAQYDGISIPIILRDLRSAYIGGELSQSTPYSKFIRYSTLQSKSSEAEAFWRSLLADSKMTDLVEHSKPSCTNLVDKSQTKFVHLSRSNSSGITFATIIKAAWS